MNDKTCIQVVAIAAIAAIAITNLAINRNDGAFAATIAGIVGGIAGYTIKSATKG